MQKRRNKIKINFRTTTLILMIFIALLLLISYVMVFGKGMHNMDLGQNIRFLEARLNVKLIDLGSDGEYRTREELFILGKRQVEKSVWLIILSSLLLGFLLGAIWKR